MLTDRELEKLQQHQANVFGLLNTLTKPAQLFIGGLEVLAGLIIAALAAIFYPIYMLYTGHPVTFDMLSLSALCLAALVMLVWCPYYTIIGGVIAVIGFGQWCWMHKHDADFGTQNVLLLFFYFVAFGYLQRLVFKLIKKIRERRYNPEVEIIPPSDYYLPLSE